MKKPSAKNLRKSIPINATNESEFQINKQTERLLELSPEGIWIHENLVIRYANAALLEMLGYESGAELCGSTIFENVPVEFHEPLRARQDLLYKAGKAVPVREFEVFRKDRSRISVEVTASIFPGMEKNTIIAYFRNVTERKEAERRMREAEGAQRAILDAVPDLLFEIDADGRYLNYHSPRTELLAAPPEKLIGHNISDVLPADAVEVVKSAMGEAARAGYSTGKHLRLNLPQGEVWFELSVSQKSGTDKTEHTFVVLSRDITERKKAENSLRESEEKLRAQHQAFPMPSYVWQRKEDHFVLIDVSQVALAFTNGTARKFIGLKNTEFMADQPEIIRDMELCFSEKKTIRTEGKYRQPSIGRERFMNVTYTYVPPDMVIVYVDDITERKRIENQLRENDIRLREAQRISRIGSWELNLQTNELLWSEEIFRIFEIDPAKFPASYEAFLGAIHPEDRDMVNRAYLQSVELRSPYEVIHRLLMHDGREKWVREKAETSYDANGSAIRSIGTVQDITEQKRIELAQQYAGAGIWDWDLKSETLNWSRELFQLFGLDPDSTNATFEAWEKSMHPDDRAGARRRVDVALKERIQLTSEYRVVLADGRTRWINAIGNTTYDVAGNPTRMTGICIDITEKKLTEIEMDRIYADLQTMQFALDQHSIVGMTDAKGKIIHANDRFCEISGYSRAELIGKTHAIINSGYHAPEFFRDMWRTILSGKVWTGEVCNRKKNGGLYWVETSIIPVIHPLTGKPKQYIGIRTDITERKRYLESLDRSLREKEVLLAEVHHRVKNNLQVVSSLISMQSHMISDQVTLNHLSNLSLRIRAMGLLHTKLYKSSDIGRVEMRDYLSSIVRQILSAQSENRKSVETRFEMDEVYLNIETSLPIGLIVTEIISNSMKYAFNEVAKPLLRLLLKKDGHSFVLQISDNGPGLMTAQETASTLGLRLVRGLSRQINGDLQMHFDGGAVTRIKFTEQQKEEKRWAAGKP